MTGKRKPPLACALCSLPMWNDENVYWAGPDGAEPYCSPECAALANAEYVWDHQPHKPEAGR